MTSVATPVETEPAGVFRGGFVFEEAECFPRGSGACVAHDTANSRPIEHDHVPADKTCNVSLACPY